MPKDKKKVTKRMASHAHGLYRRALLLQRAMYDFREQLEAIGREDLAQQLEDGAFEMDLTWNNAEKVAKEVTKLFVNQ